MNEIAAKVVGIEAEALRALAERLRGPMSAAFQRAVELLGACNGLVVVTGMGKSGIVARKIAATLNSTGTPSLYLHPAEALHGDLGMLVRGDAVLALSASGETDEILRLLATIKRLCVTLISVTGDAIYDSAERRQPPKATKKGSRERRSSLRMSQLERLAHRAVDPHGKPKSRKLSTLAQAADIALDCSVAQEACSLGVAPTASTTTMMALGDALA